MLQPPHVRARQRFLRRYLGPIVAGTIIGAGGFYFLVLDGGRPAAASAPAAPTSSAPAPLHATAPFVNCAAARAAGAAPVRRGQPGYGPHLDRDQDGIGCEPYPGR